MKRMVKKRLLWVFMIFASIFFLNSNSLTAKEKPLNGQDENGNEWTYDRETKTLTFSGTADLEYYEMDGHSTEPRWWCWSKEAEHLLIEPGITGLPGEEFTDFTRLKTVDMPNTVTYIGDWVFKGCKELEMVKMSENITFIGDAAFANCINLKNADIPRKVTTIGSCAFTGCRSIKELEIHDKVTKIGELAFDGCEGLESVRLPENLKVIEEGLFRNCKKLSEIKLPASVKKIGIAAFLGSGITYIDIPENATSFYRGELWHFDDGVFQDCKKLKVITIKSRKLKHIYKDAFLGLNKNTVIKVPKSCLKKYKKMFREAGLDKKVKVKAISGKKKFSTVTPKSCPVV